MKIFLKKKNLNKNSNKQTEKSEFKRTKSAKNRLSKSKQEKNSDFPEEDYQILRMPSNRSPLLAASLLLLLSVGPLATWARPNPSALADLKEDIPVEELYNELVEEEQKLHDKEVNYIQVLGAVAARQLREEELLQHQERRQERQRAHLAQLAAAVNGDNGDQEQQQQASLLDELPAAMGESSTSRLAREQQQQQLLAPKAMTYQKAKDEKKNNHYMALCHFKLCNMGRKRNTRFLHFWN